MDNVESIQDKFSASFQTDVSESVPIKKVVVKLPSQPIWFSKHVNALVNSHRKLYNTFKRTGNLFHLDMYRKLRRINKKAFQTLKAFVSEEKCVNPC